MIKHADDCGWHVDQYPWECTCGAIPRKAAMDELIADSADELWAKHEREHLFDRIEALTAEVERLRAALVAERKENLWNAYVTGDVRGDEWTHMFMSNGEWLAKECGFDPRQGYYSAEAIRNAIPIAARAALNKETAETFTHSDNV